jgi:hypothetical protein
MYFTGRFGITKLGVLNWDDTILISATKFFDGYLKLVYACAN